MNGEVTLEWQYVPTDYLEEGHEANNERYTLSIRDGKAVAKIEEGYFDAHPEIREQLRREVEIRLQSTQLIKGQKFELTYTGMSKIGPDGRTHQFIELHSTLALRSTVHSLDVQIRDGSGNVTFDSKQERLMELASLTNLLLKHQKDIALNVLLGHFTAAMNDPDNEFVHLYDIHDALDSRFGKKNRHLGTLNLDSNSFGQFMNICNDKNLRQSRHRGSAIGKLRDATSDELATVRNFAKEMIISYALYLEKLEASKAASGRED